MTTSAKAPAPTTPVEPRQTRKFTVDEYYRMAGAGILHHTERVELVNGEIIVMPPIGPRHGSGVDRFTHYFAQNSQGRFIVRTQGAIRVGEHSEPEPDIALLMFREDFYYSLQPGPADILLVIEVSDSTLAYDREVKAHLYGRFGIPEAWVMNLPEDCIERFDQPGPEGYTWQTIYRRGDKISPSALPDLEFAVDDLLPPAASSDDNTITE